MCDITIMLHNTKKMYTFLKTIKHIIIEKNFPSNISTHLHNYN